MHYLHTFRMNGVRTPIIHADLKSPNVMLTNLSSGLFQPSIQLIDFGLSMHRRSAMNESKRQGTVAYMVCSFTLQSPKIPLTHCYQRLLKCYAEKENIHLAWMSTLMESYCGRCSLSLFPTQNPLPKP